jgi:type IV pilus assembly protein PilN
MIEINLLPHREAKRAADLRQTVALLILGLVLAGGGIFIVQGRLSEERETAQAVIRQLEADIARYRPQEKQVEEFKKTRSELEEKLDVIRGLDRARSGPVRILDELSTNTPERLWLTKLETVGRAITVEGESLDTGVVADFLRELNRSAYFSGVDLERTERGREVEGVKLVNFVITAQLEHPDEDAAPAEGGEA